MTGPSASSGWERRKGRAGGVAPLSRGAGAAARGGNAGRPAASRAPLFQPRVPEPPDRRRGVRRPPPAVPLRSLPMPGRHGGRLGPHPPWVLRTHRRGLAPLPARGAGRLLAAPPLQPASSAPTPRPMARVGVPFPRDTSAWPRGLSGPSPITPPLYRPVPLPLSKAFSRPASGHRLRGPCHLPDLLTFHSDPAVPTLRHPSCTPSWVVFAAEPSCTSMPTACKTHFSLHSFMAGTHAIVRMYGWSL